MIRLSIKIVKSSKNFIDKNGMEKENLVVKSRNEANIFIDVLSQEVLGFTIQGLKISEI